MTNNAANNIKAFQDLILPGFENYFDIEDEDYEEGVSDVDLDGLMEELVDEPFVQLSEMDDETITTLIKDSFHNVALNNKSFRIPCFAHTI